ncbi:glycosyltransferase [Anderseniella sp. Alg231-50]|uniref:glycosyltransferase n=1 Tax=Anderseniella sp. Alg231-50 TaxID=1922226 RepID=UPI000D54B0D0
MRHGSQVAVIIPAFDEADAIGKVIDGIPGWVDTIIVADNASRDGTGAIAEAHGAHVVHEPEPGYGAACLRGIEATSGHDIIVFMDGDYSDRGYEMHLLVDPIAGDLADMVIGSRTLGAAEAGSLTPQQRWGNWLACSLIRLFWGARYTDLGPYRAIAADSLTAICMQDRAFGWTVEMQLKAILYELRWREVPVSYFNRIGVSKISGTVRGTILAGHAIIGTIVRTALTARREKTRPEAS